jgi:hypothetical protein
VEKVKNYIRELVNICKKMALLGHFNNFRITIVRSLLLRISLWKIVALLLGIFGQDSQTFVAVQGPSQNDSAFWR